MSELIEKWWTLKLKNGNLARGTVLSYRDVIDRLILPKFGNTAVRAMEVEELAGWFFEQRQERLTQAQLARTILTQAFRMAISQKMHTRNLARECEPMKEEVRAKDVRGDADRWLTDSQLLELRAALAQKRQKSYLPAMVDLMLGLGLRVSEAAALKVSDIDWDAEAGVLVHIQRIIASPSSGRPYMQAHTKSGADGDRHIYAASWVVELLRELAGVANDEGYLLVNRDGGTIRPRSAAASLRNVRSKIELPSLTSHTFRRTAALAAYKSGGVESAQALMGHESPKTTLKHYLPRIEKPPVDARTGVDTLRPRDASKTTTTS